MVAEAAHNYNQQVQEQIRVGGKVPQPATYLKGIYVESALAQTMGFCASDFARTLYKKLCLVATI